MDPTNKRAFIFPARGKKVTAWLSRRGWGGEGGGRGGGAAFALALVWFVSAFALLPCGCDWFGGAPASPAAQKLHRQPPVVSFTSNTHITISNKRRAMASRRRGMKRARSGGGSRGGGGKGRSQLDWGRADVNDDDLGDGDDLGGDVDDDDVDQDGSRKRSRLSKVEEATAAELEAAERRETVEEKRVRLAQALLARVGREEEGGRGSGGDARDRRGITGDDDEYDDDDDDEDGSGSGAFGAFDKITKHLQAQLNAARGRGFRQVASHLERLGNESAASMVSSCAFLKVRGKSVTAVAITPDELTIVCGSKDGGIHRFDAVGGSSSGGGASSSL